MLKYIISIGFITLSNLSYANIGFITGERLYILMTGNSMNQLEAANYIMGVTDAMLPSTCPNTYVILRQVVDSTKKSLEQFPEERNKRNASDFIIQALKKEFSCKNESSKEDKKFFEDRIKKSKPKLLI
jgi:hypothetical protein